MAYPYKDLTSLQTKPLTQTSNWLPPIKAGSDKNKLTLFKTKLADPEVRLRGWRDRLSAETRLVTGDHLAMRSDRPTTSSHPTHILYKKSLEEVRGFPEQNSFPQAYIS